MVRLGCLVKEALWMRPDRLLTGENVSECFVVPTGASAGDLVVHVQSGRWSLSND